MWQNEQEEQQEINLMPVISVLAVCISFLLVTAVWVQVGSFNLNQALGTEAKEKSKVETPALWVELQTNGSVLFKVKKGDSILSSSRSNSGVKRIDDIVQAYKEQNPDMTMAVVLPAPNSNYESLMKIMNGIKKGNIANIGIAPL